MGKEYTRRRSSTKNLSMKIAIIQGVNIRSVGSRQPEIYGTRSMEDEQKGLEQSYPDLLSFLYSEDEGELVQIIQRAGQQHDAIIINPGAYTHTSVAIADALRAVGLPAVEVHISQVYSREPYRRRSYIAEVCQASISGMGLYGYRAAIDYILHRQA